MLLGVVISLTNGTLLHHFTFRTISLSETICDRVQKNPITRTIFRPPPPVKIMYKFGLRFDENVSSLPPPPRSHAER